MKTFSIIGILLVQIFVSIALVHAQQDFPDEPMIPNSYAQTENSIAINPNNPNNILVCSNGRVTSGNDIQITRFYSTDGGDTWNGSEDNPSQSTKGDPVAFFDAEGNAFCVSRGHPNGINVWKSTDGGNEWIVNQGADVNFGPDDKPHAIADLSGIHPTNIYFAWSVPGSGNPSPIMFTRSTNNASGFEEPRQLDGARNQAPNIAVGPTGEVYIVWNRCLSNSWQEFQLIFQKSTDGGVTFSSLPSIPIAGINNVFSDRQAAFNNTAVNSYPSMGVDRSSSSRRGWVYVVYAAKNGNNAAIYLQRSADGGASWSSNAIRVDSDPNATQQWFPSISVDPVTGYLFISYYMMSGAGFSTARYLAYSTDGGDNFNTIQVSDVSFTPSELGSPNRPGYMGDYYETAAYGSKAYASWSDNRTSIFQAFISKFALPVSITLDQKLQEGTRVGTIGRWNGNSFNPRLSPPQTIPSLAYRSNEVLQADSNVYSNQKYYRWNSDPDVANHHTFLIDGIIDNFTSNFKPIASGVKIQTDLLC